MEKKIPWLMKKAVNSIPWFSSMLLRYLVLDTKPVSPKNRIESILLKDLGNYPLF